MRENSHASCTSFPSQIVRIISISYYIVIIHITYKIAYRDQKYQDFTRPISNGTEAECSSTSRMLSTSCLLGGEESSFFPPCVKRWDLTWPRPPSDAIVCPQLMTIPALPLPFFRQGQSTSVEILTATALAKLLRSPKIS